MGKKDKETVIPQDVRQDEQRDPEILRLAQQEARKSMAIKKQKEKAYSQPIGKEQVKKAWETLEEYRKAKANLDQRIVENELYYKLNHLNPKEQKKKEGPRSAWLFNSIANKHADAMDNYPEPFILPRAHDDVATAQTLTKVLPVVLEYNDYEQVYSDTWWYKLKQGTGVKKIVWDSKKNNGLGDIDIQKTDILNLFWQPGVTDIQRSRNFFHVELVDNEVLKQRYPNIEANSGGDSIVTQYLYDESIDTSEKTAVVDWYYKQMVEDREVVHFCKFCNSEVLYASENDPEYATRGYYDHGKYPFVFDTLFPVEDSPAGFGYIDVMKDPQKYIDKMNKNIMDNAIRYSKKRWIVRNDCSINKEEFADWDKEIVTAEGNLGEDSFRELSVNQMPTIYLNVLNAKVDELKETSGNRDFSQGSTQSGVTAASAIAALQEAGSKLSRDMIKAAYRAYKKECELVIELMRQFYEEPRYFRITNEQKKEDFVTFDNTGIKPINQGNDFGVEMGERVPIFDVNVTAAKKSAYSRLSQNELALQFYGLGFFNPQQSDQALACLEMMDFENKDKIMRKIQGNGTMWEQIQMLRQQMIQMAQIIDAQNGTTITQGIAGEVVANAKALENQDMVMLQGNKSKEESRARAARERVSGAAAPS